MCLVVGKRQAGENLQIQIIVNQLLATSALKQSLSVYLIKFIELLQREGNVYKIRILSNISRSDLFHGHVFISNSPDLHAPLNSTFSLSFMNQ